MVIAKVMSWRNNLSLVFLFYMDLNKIKKIHIVGIEGAGTSALARLLAMFGKVVTGTDEGDHFYADVLNEKGVSVFHKFSRENIGADIDLVIHSTAYRVDNNEELQAAIEQKIKVITYPEALAEVFNQKTGIAVCGSHGKTTTSAWLTFVLNEAGKSPSAIIGSKVPQLGGNALAGESNLFVIEADEYQNKLKNYQPKMVLLNNIDYDHPDFFPTIDDYLQAFVDFISRIPKKGCLIANFDDPNIAKIANVNCLGRVISYGIENQENFYAHDIRFENGKQYFGVAFEGGDLGEFVISLLGRHNIYNALAVIAICIELDLPLVDIRRYLEEFKGTAQRAEVMGEWRGVTIINDYAHHPTEIKTTLAGLREAYYDRKMVCVFCPHTFSRTEALFNDFATSFNVCDELIVLDIFGSTRERSGTVSSIDLVEKIKIQNEMSHKKVSNIHTLAECEEYLREHIERGDLLVLMGAGDVYRIGKNLLK